LEYGFKFAEKIDSEIVKIGFSGLIETAEAGMKTFDLASAV
jgi:hypothetical protein